MHIITTTAFCIAMGFASAGLCASGYSLATHSRLSFESRAGATRSARARLVLLVICGPLVIMRNAIRAARRDLRPRGWLVASALLASGWSFCLGLAVINILVAAGVFAT